MARKLKAKAGGGLWKTASIWEDETTKEAAATAPGVEDDCKLDKTSGAVTCDTTSKCRSLDMSEYESKLKINAGKQLAVGGTTTQKEDKWLLKIGALAEILYETTGEMVLGGNKASSEDKVSIAAGFYTKGAGNLMPVTQIGPSITGKLKLEEAGVKTASTTLVTLKTGEWLLNGTANEWGKFYCAEGSATRKLIGGAGAKINLTGIGSGTAGAAPWYVNDTTSAITINLASGALEITDTSASLKECTLLAGTETMGTVILSGTEIYFNFVKEKIPIEVLTISGDKVKTTTFKATTFNINTAGKTTGWIPFGSVASEFTTLTTNGSSGSLATISGLSTGELKPKLTKASGVVLLDYTKIKNLKAEGGATFRANFAKDEGENSGISFEEPRNYSMLL